MYFKVLLLAVSVAAATAQYAHNNGFQSNILAHQPVVLQHQASNYAAPHQKDYNVPAHYSFNYGVQDPHTGDFKSQHESREGDLVRGEYSLHEADGTVRRVEYSVDPHSGFNAVVHREGQSAHQAPNYH